MDTTRPESTAGELARMRALLAHAPLAMAFVRMRRFGLVSDQMNHLFGHDEGTELAGQSTRAVHVSDAAYTMLGDRLSSAFNTEHPLDEEIEYVRRDGSRFWGRLQAHPVEWSAADGEQLWVIDDVTAARQLRMQPSWGERHDPVTELANRREFERRMVEHVGSQRQVPVSVLWLDIDHFRDLVERMGAPASDRFLCQLARLIVAKVRASDVVARLDTDRFAVLLPECDQHHAQLVGEKLRAAVAAYRLRWGVRSTRVKICVGVVQIHHSLSTVQAVLDAALHACDTARKAGGDSVRVFVPQAGSDPELAALD